MNFILTNVGEFSGPIPCHLKTEDFCQSYGTTDGINQFVDFIKKQNGLTEYKYSYQKKSIHAVAITMKFFEPLLRRRLFQKVALYAYELIRSFINK